MTVNQEARIAETESGPRLHIKQVARRLIAERGMHNVGVRDIAHEAGQRNLGVVAYYFGTKEKLIAEILIDGAERIEALRRDYLADLEAAGGPKTVREAVGAIVLPSATFSENDALYGSYFNRYMAQLSAGDGKLIDRTLEGRWNTGYQHCLTHLRRLLPELSRAEQSRRFVFLSAYLGALLSQREAMLQDHGGVHLTWRSAETLDDIVGTAAALLTAPSVRR